MSDKQFLYDGYITKLSKRFENKFSEMQVGANFEYGPEFEIALCEILDSALPEQYGVVRGYVVSKDGQKAGDDIIIYEKIRFPTLRQRNQSFYENKQYIPIEAVYCYIEAKHTLHLEGDDPQSISHASQQVLKVKELIATRPIVSLDPVQSIGPDFEFGTTMNFPTYRNPPFGAIFARQVKKSKDGSLLTDPREIEAILVQKTVPGEIDLGVIGKTNVVLPLVHNKEGTIASLAPFFIPDKTRATVIRTDGYAFGIGLSCIMAALEWIQLGVMPWDSIIINGFSR